MSAEPVALSVVLPCYNEAASLPESIPPLLRALEAEAFSFEVILVDNGSTDATGEAIARLAAAHPRLRPAKVDVNRGYGGGVLAGLACTDGVHLAFLGADGQVAPAQVVEVLRRGVASPPGTLVKALRRSRGDGPLRWGISKAYNLLARMLLAARSGDLNATPKVLHREDLPRLGLTSMDWFLDAECMLRAAEEGFALVEVPVDFLPRRGGRSHVRMSAVAEFLGNLWRFRAWRRRD